MNWFRGRAGDQRDNESNGGQGGPSSTPDANELRRRRLAKLKESQAAEKARRKDLEERKAKWMAEMKAKGATTEAQDPSPTTTPAAPPAALPSPLPIPKLIEEPQPKRMARSLPSTEHMISKLTANSLGIALTPVEAGADLQYIPDLIKEMRIDSKLSADQPLLLNVDMHADDILLKRINSEANPLEYLFQCFVRCSKQSSDIRSNSRISGKDYAEGRVKLEAAVAGVERRIMMYFGMLLNGSFMEANVNPDAFAVAIMSEAVPSGFIRALIHRHTEGDASGFDDLVPVFSSVFMALYNRARTDMKLSSNSFLKPLKALSTLLVHKELCKVLITLPRFIPKANRKVGITVFASTSYLYPFFTISALPGQPLRQPKHFPEDPLIASSMFPNPTLLSRAEAEGAIYSLRSSLSIARSYLYGISLALCKAGQESKKAMLDWFGIVCNLNKKRTGMHPNAMEVSRDGFILNVMCVLLKLCEPIVGGGWKMLDKIDPSYPQSGNSKIDYEDETRLAADTNMLKRWWVDKRNENAQQSLARQLEVNEREAVVSATESASGADSAQGSSFELQTVATDFNFVTECFWLCLRFVQLGFVAVTNMYDDALLRILHQMKDAIRDMEIAKSEGTLPPDQIAQLAMYKTEFDLLLQAKLCYDVYLRDPELLTSLVRFVTADAEWLIKKVLMKPERKSLLPLPVPPSPTFASLPEHTVETITTVLLTTMRTNPNIVEDNSALLDGMVSFCIAGSSSPLHVKNPYLRAKLIEFLWTIFPRGSNVSDSDDEDGLPRNTPMEALFAGHLLSRKFLSGSLFRLYVDVEHTGSHTQFYDKFAIRYRIGSILESVWHMTDYRKSVHNEARDEGRFLRFINMVLNDANHLLDSALDDLEEMHTLEMLIEGNSEEWQSLSDEEKSEKKTRLQRLEGSIKSHNQLGNKNVKLLWLLTDDGVVRRIFLRPEMVSRIAEMLNYLLVRLCGRRCSDLKVSEPEKVFWKPRQLLTRMMRTYIHFYKEESFAAAVAKDGRSYSAGLFAKAIGIATRRRLLPGPDIQKFRELAAAAAKAQEEENEEEENLGEIPDEFLDPIMSCLMRDPVRLPTSGNVMDRAVISRILLDDKADPFNRKLLTEEMLVEEVDLKQRIRAFIQGRKHDNQS